METTLTKLFRKYLNARQLFEENLERRLEDMSYFLFTYYGVLQALWALIALDRSLFENLYS
jgi:hypothetical protein